MHTSEFQWLYDILKDLFPECEVMLRSFPRFSSPGMLPGIDSADPCAQMGVMLRLGGHCKGLRYYTESLVDGEYCGLDVESELGRGAMLSDCLDVLRPFYDDLMKPPKGIPTEQLMDNAGVVPS